ncbi:MAG: hypothetical protein M3Y17_03485 [Actinomycetota bacterium]|nr:hypothetical protein [Actinomycetota bacterium]
MRYLPVVLAVGMLVVAVGGCGSGGARTAGAGAQVETSSCQSSGADGHVTSQSCSFVLSDGQQFRCHKAFEGSTPTARVLEHTKGCVGLPSLKLFPAVRRMIAGLGKAQRCLTAKGVRVVGGPVLPPVSPRSSSPDGELALSRSAADAVFIAFYTDAARAQRLQAVLIQSARRVKGQVERHGAVTVLWIHPPSGIRAAVQACAFG